MCLSNSHESMLLLAWIHSDVFFIQKCMKFMKIVVCVSTKVLKYIPLNPWAPTIVLSTLLLCVNVCGIVEIIKALGVGPGKPHLCQAIAAHLY